MFMFEQESYDRASVPTPTQPGELFYNYEVRSWFASPTLYKVLAISAVLNLVFLAVVSQTNVLTARGCDSPWVGRVCQVVDLAYVSAMLYGTDREYVDEAYEHIDLADADITYVDLTGSEPLKYPEGYFQIANPVQFQMMQQQAANPDGSLSGFSNNGINPTLPSTVPNNDKDLLAQRANPPVANPGALTGDDSSDSPFKIENTTPNTGGFPSRKGRRGPVGTRSNSGKTPVPGEDQKVAGNKPEPTPAPSVDPTKPENDVDINKRPFIDLGNFVNGEIASKNIKLDAPFSLTARGKLTKDGKLDPKNFAYGQASGSQEVVDLTKFAIEKTNESGLLQYLSLLSGKDLNLEIKQDDVNISAVIQSEVESETRAKTLSSLLYSMLDYKKKQKVGPDADQNDKDDLALLEGAKIEAVGKRLVITFEVPKAIAHPMIQRKLQERAAEFKKENSNADLKLVGNTAAK